MVGANPGLIVICLARNPSRDPLVWAAALLGLTNAVVHGEPYLPACGIGATGRGDAQQMGARRKRFDRERDQHVRTPARGESILQVIRRPIASPRPCVEDPHPLEFPTVALPSASNYRVNDTELVERTRAGDANAFGELVERYQAAVYRAARAALHSATEADDVTQDAFIAAFRHLGEFRSDASFKTWLLAIAWNTARTHRRGTWRWIERFRSSVDGERPLGPKPLPSQEVALIGRDLQARVKRLVLTLSPKYRDVLLLATSDDLSMDDIGAILQIPPGTVKWRLSEGRRQLRSKLVRLGIRDE